MPEDILTLLKSAYALIAGGDLAGHLEVLSRASAQIGALPDGAQKRLLRAEHALASALERLGDADAVLACFERAHTLFAGTRSRLLAQDVLLCMGAPDPFVCFWRKPGTADRLLAPLSRIAALSVSITGAEAGMDTLYAACLAFYRGRLDDAAAGAYRAVYAAEGAAQNMLGMYGARLLARIALHRGDPDEWEYAARTIRRFGSRAADEPLCALYSTMIQGELSALLGGEDTTPLWQHDGDFGVTRGEGPYGFGYRLNGSRLPYCAFPFAMSGHIRTLVSARQHSRVLAVCDYQHTLGVDSMPILGVSFDLARASALAGLRRFSEAEELLSSVIGRVEPDGLWMLPAEYAPYLGGLFDKALLARGSGALAYVQALAASYARGRARIRRLARTQSFPADLTAREFDVAKLAAQGRTNDEIAAELGISVNTVKMHLKSVFEKLQIRRRIELVRALVPPFS